MIKHLSSETDQKILEKLVNIHKRCITKINSKFYGNEQIQEWISSINLKNIQNQLVNTTWIVIEDTDRMIGFAQYSKKESVIYQIQIDPDLQGKGYGKKLLDYIEEDFRKNNIKKISLFATINAITFYENLDFSPIKHINFKLVNTEVKMIEMLKELD